MGLGLGLGGRRVAAAGRRERVEVQQEGRPHCEADHGVEQRRIVWAADAVSAASRHRYIGARKGARDLWIGRLAQQPGARLAGHPVPKRASNRLSPPELPRCIYHVAWCWVYIYRVSVSLRLISVQRTCSSAASGQVALRLRYVRIRHGATALGRGCCGAAHVNRGRHRSATVYGRPHSCSHMIRSRVLCRVRCFPSK